MAFSNEIVSVWKEGKASDEGCAPLGGKDLHAIISSRVRKQFKTVSQFVWAAIVYQIILYSFLAHTLVRHWGDLGIMLLWCAGAAIYVPLTVVLMRRVRELYPRVAEVPRSSGSDILHHVEDEYKRLVSFFRVKKRMDWIGVPVSSAIIVLVTFTLFGGAASRLAPWGA